MGVVGFFIGNLNMYGICVACMYFEFMWKCAVACNKGNSLDLNICVCMWLRVMSVGIPDIGCG